ncbi:MAG: NADH-quinone oxidoreductase subunit J [Acidimicrobiales bacterium]|jgi:NADH-quinone oxidoreductase subunit J|nr:NADH-quinone oxidoreductase subunit J [Acidimicrobiales bacterium]|tara:strand:- start:1607 stop:2185 length:579 start_codon:yes stop_codon:yes gene_type:complete
METIVFLISAVVILSGALGVIFSKNPVHSALFMVQTLFGAAVLFVLLEATFLAAIQVIVYAGAIVILFVFVITLLGIDRAEDLKVEPIAGQRPLAVVLGASIFGIILTVLIVAVGGPTGVREANTPIGDAADNTRLLGETLFSKQVFSVELTALLLTVAVIGAVVLSARPQKPLIRTLQESDTEEETEEGGE